MKLEVLTPEKKIFEDDVDFVVVPSWEGEWGILPKHTYALLAMQPGEIRIYKNDKIDYLAVSGGFVWISPQKVEIFAQTAQIAQEINIEEQKMLIENLKLQKLNVIKAGTPQDLEKIEISLKMALARLKVVADLQKRHSVSKTVDNF